MSCDMDRTFQFHPRRQGKTLARNKAIAQARRDGKTVVDCARASEPYLARNHGPSSVSAPNTDKPRKRTKSEARKAQRAARRRQRA